MLKSSNKHNIVYKSFVDFVRTLHRLIIVLAVVRVCVCVFLLACSLFGFTVIIVAVVARMFPSFARYCFIFSFIIFLSFFKGAFCDVDIFRFKIAAKPIGRSVRLLSFIRIYYCSTYICVVCANMLHVVSMCCEFQRCTSWSMLLTNAYTHDIKTQNKRTSTINSNTATITWNGTSDGEEWRWLERQYWAWYITVQSSIVFHLNFVLWKHTHTHTDKTYTVQRQYTRKSKKQQENALITLKHMKFTQTTDERAKWVKMCTRSSNNAKKNEYG